MFNFSKSRILMISAGVLAAAFCLAGCGAENNISEETVTSELAETSLTTYNDISEKVAAEILTLEETAQRAYLDFLSGDVSMLEDTVLGQEWTDFYLPNSELEYVFLDLDGDDISELLIQYADSPETLNAVFNYEDGKLICWNFDSVEMSGRDYPLQNGTMVRQYDFNGTRSYTGFRYLTNGEREELFNLFARDELIPENDTSPCPYYEIDGNEAEQTMFDSELEEQIFSQRLDKSAWTAITS